MGGDGNRGELLLKLNNSFYGIKQASENWFDLLRTILEIMCYQQSQADLSVFYRKYAVVLT